jgi:hypothetical protein
MSRTFKMRVATGLVMLASVALLTARAEAEKIPVMLTIACPRTAVPLRSFARFTATLRESTVAPYHGAGLAEKGLDLAINGTTVDTQVTTLRSGIGFAAFSYFVPADLGVGTGNTARVTYSGDDVYAPGVAWDWWETTRTPTAMVMLVTKNPAPYVGTYRATITLYQMVGGAYIPLPNKPIHICYCVTHCTDRVTDGAGRVVEVAAVNGFCTIRSGFLGDETYAASCCCPCYYK